MADERRKYDMVIFGATGYTGQHAVEELARVAQQEKGLAWAIAGRSKSKLASAIKTAEEITKLDLADIPIIIADVKDEESLVTMAKQAKVVLNCVGPYRLYGEPVVKACVENGASHVDITGEPQFLELMQLKYHDLAVKNNVYIIGACGYDCVPSDLGVVFLGDNFKGDLNSAEVYMKMDGYQSSGPIINYGTWHSLIYFVHHYNEIKQLQEKQNVKPLPKSEVKLSKRSVIHYSRAVKQWCIPFMGYDAKVAMKSQQLLSENYHQRPVQVAVYQPFATIFHCIVMLLGSAILFALCHFKFTLDLLAKYPRFFTFGKVGKGDVPRTTNAKLHFRHTIVGEGWEEKLAEPTDKHKEAPNKKLVVMIEGKDPGYVFTTTCLVQCGLTIVKESAKIPGEGGVLSPGGAFAKTSIIERLSKRGYAFTVVK